MSSETRVAGVGPDRPSLVGLAGLAAAGAPWKMLVVSWVAFAATAGAAALGARSAGTDAIGLVWGTASPAGATVTSAAVFLVLQAVGFHGAVGGFGVAAVFLAWLAVA